MVKDWIKTVKRLLIVLLALALVTAIFSAATIPVMTPPQPETETVLVEIIHEVIVPVYQPVETVVVYETVEVPPANYEYLVERVQYYEEQTKDSPTVFEVVSEDHYYAAYIWDYLQHCLELSPAALAGILGNMMNECGGNTLRLNPYIWNASKTHYGLCQWSKVYNPEVINSDINGQLEYLCATIVDVFNTYGYLYKKGFNYEAFCTLRSPDEAADAFRIIYERPGPTSAAQRRYNARLAYCTFVF